MSTEARIGVVGATGAVGAEILGVLDRAPWRPPHVVALARTSSHQAAVDYGDERLPVVPFEPAALADLDAVLLAVPEDAAVEIGSHAVDEGLAVVDLSGALRDEDDAAVLVPWINPEPLLETPQPVVVLPGPGAMLLASVLGPLRRAGIGCGVVATQLVPASARGRGAVEELAGQVRALFNQETPPRKHFEQGLAFDLLPADGPLEADGATASEARVVDDLARLLGQDPASVALQSVGVPVFSGFSASVVLRPALPVDAETVERVLADGGVVLPEAAGERALPRPRRVEGRPFAHVGRLRVGDDGAVRLWLSMDNLRTAATAAVASVAALLGVGREPGSA